MNSRTFSNQWLVAVNKLQKDTNSYKKSQLTQLMSKLNKLDALDDLDEDGYQDLAKYYNQLLNDTKFTYKRFTLFNETSRSKQLILDLARDLESNKLQAAFAKLDKAVSETAKVAIDNIKNLIENRNYQEALKQFQILNLTHPVNAARFINKWLQRRIHMQVDIGASHFRTYTSVDLDLGAKRKDQKVFNVDELKTFMLQQPHNKLISFTYAVDRFGNAGFSLDAVNSFHMNIFHAEPVKAAGEIYLKNTPQGIGLATLNNKSGLYRPETGYFESLKAWFGRHKILIRNTRCEDEREKLIRDRIELRFLCR